MPSRLGALNGLIDFNAFRISNSMHLEFQIHSYFMHRNSLMSLPPQRKIKTNFSKLGKYY